VPTDPRLTVATLALLGSLSCSHSLAGPIAPGQADGAADSAVEDSGPVQSVLVGPNGDHTFLPAALTIPVGTTVQWFWESAGHTVTSGPGGVADGQFCSPGDTDCATAPTSGVGTTYQHTFTTPGTFPYFCVPHYDVGMKGTITVQ
jgi:plastocyanin